MGEPETQPSPLMHHTVQAASSNRRLHGNHSRTVNLLGGGFSAEVRGQLRIIYICRAAAQCPQHCAAVLPVQPVNTHLFVTNVRECKIICGRLVQPPQLYQKKQINYKNSNKIHSPFFIFKQKPGCLLAASTLSLH